MSDWFSKRRRSDRMTAKSNHQLYRVYEIPGLRESHVYEGSGVEGTYNLRETDLDYPKNENAVPVLIDGERVSGEVMNKTVECSTATCESCGSPGYIDERGLPVCRNCGLVLVGEDERPQERLVHSKLSAERFDETHNDE